jgi:RHS repeat-associated protein
MEGNGALNKGRENAYLYNGKELNVGAQRRSRQACGKEFGLNWLSYGAREYDPAIGRFMTIDRFAEKYTSMTPYQYGANNPIKFIDVNGDSIDVSAIANLKDKRFINTLVSNLSEITGLNVSHSNGFLTYEENENSSGSSTASEYLKSLIDEKKETVEVVVSGISRTKGNKVELGFPQIENLISNNPDELNKNTLGWGMTLIHELKHTDAGGGLKDPEDKTDFSSTGDVVDFVNKIRNELDSQPGQSKPYGVRLHYFYKPTDRGARQLNFRYNTVNSKGRVKQKYASFILK